MVNESNRMRWNLGGWLGGQVGGSCWMLVAGLLSVSADPSAAGIVLGLFVIANLSVWLIWRRRTSMTPYQGLQLLVPVLGASGIAAVYVLDKAGIYETIQVGASVTAWETYTILFFVIVFLMVILWWRDRRR